MPASMSQRPSEASCGTTGVADFVLQGAGLAGVGLHDHDLVARGQEIARELAANLAAAGDDDEHGR